MAREELQLESWRFTSISALAREILTLLENSDYKLEILLKSEELERLTSEMESVRYLGRLKLTVCP